MANSRVLLAFVIGLAITAAGCPESPGTPLPSDLPARRDIPNPDFLQKSVWLAESPRSPLREIRLAEKNLVSIRLENAPGRITPIPGGLANGTYALELAQPDEDQTLFQGYPRSVSTPQAHWFTDNAQNPSTAHLCVLLPVRPGGPDYVVLMGMYVRGLETMEWDIMTPVRYPGSKKLELRPTSGSAYKGELIFRREIQNSKTVSQP